MLDFISNLEPRIGRVAGRDEPNKYTESSVIACGIFTTKTMIISAHNPPLSAGKVRKGLSYRALVKHRTSRYVLVLNCASISTKTENSLAFKKVTSIKVCKHKVMNGFLLFTTNPEE